MEAQSKNHWFNMNECALTVVDQTLIGLIHTQIGSHFIQNTHTSTVMVIGVEETLEIEAWLRLRATTATPSILLRPSDVWMLIRLLMTCCHLPLDSDAPRLGHLHGHSNMTMMMTSLLIKLQLGTSEWGVSKYVNIYYSIYVCINLSNVCSMGSWAFETYKYLCGMRLFKY